MNNHIQLFSIESFYKKKDELNKQLDGKLITIDQYISKLNKLEKKLPKNKQQTLNQIHRLIHQIYYVDGINGVLVNHQHGNNGVDCWFDFIDHNGRECRCHRALSFEDFGILMSLQDRSL
jgi:hypothetical protein